MNKELDQKLCSEFPSIFRDRHGDKTSTLMCWGFECGDGWYNIIRGLCLSLTYNYDTAKDLKLDGRVMLEYTKYDDPEFDSYFWHHNGSGDVVATQVKEKFGTLRFYYGQNWKEKEISMAALYPKTAELIFAERCKYVDGIVDMAEKMSGITCEETGLIGELHTSGTGWFKTLNCEYAKTNEFCKSRGYTLRKKNENV